MFNFNVVFWRVLPGLPDFYFTYEGLFRSISDWKNSDVQVDGVGTYWRNSNVQVDGVGTDWRNSDVQVDGVGTDWRNSNVQVDGVGTGLSDL